MTGFPFRLPLAVPLSSLALALLSGCASGGGPPIPVTTTSLIDDYVMVRGMATGRLLTSDIDRDQVLRIVALDHAALHALAASAADPASATAKDEALAAIRALAAYAASTPSGPSVVVVRTGQR